MIPTPDLSHLSSNDYVDVYEPAEDTFILLDALEQDAAELQALKPAVCLEIGSGSGCVSAFTAQILGSGTLFICTDINKQAVQATVRTGIQNHVNLNAIQASVAAPLLRQLQRKVDILLLNPPYVPTISEEVRVAQQTKKIEGAWAGGIDGMEVTNVVLDCVEHLLSPYGRFYLVALKVNGIDTIRCKMENQYNLKSKVCLERQAGREHLYVLCFQRT